MKRFEWLLKVAQVCPAIDFDVVGVDGAIDTCLLGQGSVTEKPVNIRMHGYVPPVRIPYMYRSAMLLCCTSAFEGFPNTFLEAWSHGLPVVSTFDPDGIIAERELGIVADDVAGLARGIRRLQESHDLWHRMSENSQKYVREVHSPDVVLPQFEEVLLSAIQAQQCSK